MGAVKLATILSILKCLPVDSVDMISSDGTMRPSRNINKCIAVRRHIRSGRKLGLETCDVNNDLFLWEYNMITHQIKSKAGDFCWKVENNRKIKIATCDSSDPSQKLYYNSMNKYIYLKDGDMDYCVQVTDYGRKHVSLQTCPHIKWGEEASYWDAWGTWDACTATCDGGTTMRYRSCVGRDCSTLGSGYNSESGVCNAQSCTTAAPVTTTPEPKEDNCSCHWSEWSACSADCPLGKKTRTFINCIRSNGRPTTSDICSTTPYWGMEDNYTWTCDNSSEQQCLGVTQSCECHWSNWSMCSNDCPGVRTRTYTTCQHDSGAWYTSPTNNQCEAEEPIFGSVANELECNWSCQAGK